MKKQFLLLWFLGFFVFFSHLMFPGQAVAAAATGPDGVAAEEQAEAGEDVIYDEFLQKLRNRFKDAVPPEPDRQPLAQNAGMAPQGDTQAALIGDKVMDEPVVAEPMKRIQYVEDPKEDDILPGLNIGRDYLNLKRIPAPKPFKYPETKQKVKELLSPEEILEALIAPDARERKVDLDFDEAKLSDIVMTLAEAGSFNVVLDPQLKNNIIDFHLKGATLQEALILLSNAFDLGFARVGQSLYITSKDKIRAESVTSSIVRLKNLNVTEAEHLVKGLIDEVNVSEETNSLVLVGTPNEIIEVQKLLARMDTPQPQVLLEAKIIEINKDALDKLGVDWSDSIEVSFQEGTRLAEPTNTLNPGREVFEIYKFDRTPIMFDAVIHMLENDNKAKVLSNPRITTLNNKEAEIFVGDRIPYAITTVASGVATTEVRFEEPGIRLIITPSIIDEDFVEIKIEPEVSYIYSFRGPDDQYPWVKKREAVAYVRVRNNQPFIIGGLLNQEDKKNLYKVPFLGDIPLLGNLFKYESATSTNNELIISVTPKVIGGDESAARASE